MLAASASNALALASNFWPAFCRFGYRTVPPPIASYPHETQPQHTSLSSIADLHPAPLGTQPFSCHPCFRGRTGHDMSNAPRSPHSSAELIETPELFVPAPNPRRTKQVAPSP